MSDQPTKPAAPDLERIEELRQSIAAKETLHGVERDIVNLFRESASVGRFDDRVPMTEHDSIVYEMAFRFGRADIVIFHADGTASVIEVKDGSKGYAHVVSGIGQAGLYAAQLGMARGALRSVRRCLLWSSAGSAVLDAVIEETCEQAGVIPMPWPSMALLMSTRLAVARVLGGEGYGRA